MPVYSANPLQKASGPRGDPVILNGDGKIELLDSLARQCEVLDPNYVTENVV